MKKFLITLLLLTVIAGIVYYKTYYPFKGIDDAYIYFVYAKNLATGHGFVYNPGGERVEGFTSILWLLITTLTYLVSTNFQYLLMAGNLILIGYALSRFVRFIDKYYAIKPAKYISLASLIFLSFVLVMKGYIDWTIFSLLETGLWSCVLLLLSVYLLEAAMGEEKRTGDRLYFLLLLAVLVVTRPESLLWGTVFVILDSLLVFVQTANVRKALKNFIAPALAFGLTTAALALFRIRYFGFPFPNTYYAKVSSDYVYNFKEGIGYIGKFIFIYPVYLFSVLVACIYMVKLVRHFLVSRQIKTENYTLVQFVNVLLVFTAMLVPMVNGGDHFSLFRLFQPVIPLFILPFFNPDLARFVRENVTTISNKNLRSGYIVLILVPLIYLTNMPKHFVDLSKVIYNTTLHDDFYFAEQKKNESLLLNDFFGYTPKPSIGRIWAGGYAYGYQGNTIDLMGLNNVAMAHAQKVKVGLKNHASFDKATFYKLKPVFLNGILVNDTLNFDFYEKRPDDFFENRVFKGIYADKQFIEEYTPVLLTRNNFPFGFFSYVRVDYVDTLKQNAINVKFLRTR